MFLAIFVTCTNWLLEHCTKIRDSTFKKLTEIYVEKEKINIQKYIANNDYLCLVLVRFNTHCCAVREREVNTERANAHILLH